MLVTTLSPVTTDTEGPCGNCIYVVQLKTTVLKNLCNFPPFLGSVVGQICEKKNPSRAIKNKDRKSLSYWSQEGGEASHHAFSQTLP